MPTGSDLVKTSHLISVEGTEAEVEQLIQYSEAESISLNRLSPDDAMLKNQDLGDYAKMADYFAHNIVKEGKYFALLYVRIMGLQSMYNTLGIKPVNELLKKIVIRMQEHGSGDNKLACINLGDFMFLSPVIGPYQGAAQLCVDLIQDLQRPYEIDGEPIYLKCAIGVALYPDDGKRFETLHLCAAMAVQRASEKNEQYCFYRRYMSSQDNRRHDLINALRHAHEQNEFKVYYQPKYDLKTRKLASVEALLRWQEPGGEDVSPDEFVPLLENTGLIVSVGDWVLEQACRDYAKWLDRGLDVVPIAVNVAAAQFRRAGMTDYVHHTLQNYDIPMGGIELEITESSFMSSPKQVMASLNFFKQQGIPLTIDDFGTGYSSLSYLQQFPVSFLKIDKIFVQDLPGNENNVAIVEAILAISRSFNLEVVAEGIETEVQADYLQQRGCKMGQGYLFGKAMQAEELEALLVDA